MHGIWAHKVDVLGLRRIGVIGLGQGSRLHEAGERLVALIAQLLAGSGIVIVARVHRESKAGGKLCRRVAQSRSTKQEAHLKTS